VGWGGEEGEEKQKWLERREERRGEDERMDS